MGKVHETEILYGPKLVGAQVREIIQGKYEVIPKKREHIKVNQEKCIGCQRCYIHCPTGSFEMVDGKSQWKYGMEFCGESGLCRYVCPVDAIDWSYPDGGTGIVLKYS